MNPKIYLALGALILLIICTAGVLFIRHNLSQIAQFEQDAVDADKPLKKRRSWSADPYKLADRMQSERVYAIRMHLMRPREFTGSFAHDAAEETISLLSVSYDDTLNHDDHLYSEGLRVYGEASLKSPNVYPLESLYSRWKFYTTQSIQNVDRCDSISLVPIEGIAFIMCSALLKQNSNSRGLSIEFPPHLFDDEKLSSILRPLNSILSEPSLQGAMW